MPLEIGAILQERYRIDAALSQHLNGGVYRAHDLQSEQACVVKEFIGLTAEEFEPAAQSLLHRIHPTLPEVFDHFSLDGERQYLVMEFVAGESLRARMKRRGVLTEREAASWVGQALAALEYLHNRTPPILHGDVKPDNILITPDGEAVLVDYGIRQSLNPHTPATLVAPEQVARNAEPRSDVYAAGATLYVMLTGQVPGQHSAGITDRFAIAPPRSLNEALSPAMARVIEKAMAHRAEARFENIREMRKALGRAAVHSADDDEEEAAPAAAASAPPARRARAAWSIVGAIVGVVAVAGIILFARQRAAARPAAATPTVESVALAAPSATPLAQPTEPPATPAEASAATATPSATPTPIPPTATALPTLGVGSSEVSPVDGAVMVYVPAGEFIMGSDFDDPLAFEDEYPRHTVVLPAFWIDQTEVTNVQYRACVAAGACTEPRFAYSATRLDYYEDPAYDFYPVVWVRWAQAAAYCAWAGRRLPSEPEWEKAARGTDGRIYPWGADAAAERYANFDILAGDSTRVGDYPDGASPYGVFDTAGNVAEWVDEFYTTTYYNHDARLTATPEASERFYGGLHVLRNGAWNDNLANIRTASRRFAPNGEYSANNVGFRCAADASP